MSASEKYRMFRNFIHNELGITREDIEEWTKEAATAAADRAVKRLLNDEPTLRAQIVERTARAMRESWGGDKQINAAVADRVFDLAMTKRGEP